MQAAAARGADLYASGTVSFSGGTMDTSGGGTIPGGGGVFTSSGSGTDTSPVVGGALGYSVPLREMIPYSWDVSAPDWSFRVEFEGLALRDYEFITTLLGNERYLTEVSNWGLLNNYWVDVPLYAPISWAFGRVPILEPVSLHLGGGIGIGFTSLDTTSVAFFGSEDAVHFTWQAGAGFDYRISDRVSVGVGYRYVDLGSFDYKVKLGSTEDSIPVGSFKADLVSHEARTALRVNFYSLSSPRSWKRPRFGRGR